MNNGTTTPPGYVLPSRPRWQGGWNVRALLGAVVAFVFTASAATQWLAAQLGNPVEMGDPIVWFHGSAVFQPFAGLLLWKHFAGSRLISSSVRKEIWISFGATILGGLFLAYFAYWFLSLIHGRKSTDSLMNLHGAATVAHRHEIQKLRLFVMNDGVFVGGWRYPDTREIRSLLHTGAEPVLLFAPSRSGKGVS